jgi:hypothetical protein
MVLPIKTEKRVVAISPDFLANPELFIRIGKHA